MLRPCLPVNHPKVVILKMDLKHSLCHLGPRKPVRTDP